MSLDNAKNFAKVTVSTGYDAAATSIVLSSGHGAKLPTVSFNAVWWNSTDYADPADDPNVEIVRVTAISTDTLTVTRAQESTSASTKNTAGKTYKMIAGMTAKTVNTDIGAFGIGVLFGAPAATVSTSTYYSCPGNFGSGATTEVGYTKIFRVPCAGTLKNLYVKTENAPTNNTVFTVRVNSVDSALTCTVAGATQTASDTTHTVAVSAGDYITFKLVGGTGATAAGYSMFSCQFVPA